MLFLHEGRKKLICNTFFNAIIKGFQYQGQMMSNWESDDLAGR